MKNRIENGFERFDEESEKSEKSESSWNRLKTQNPIYCRIVYWFDKTNLITALKSITEIPPCSNTMLPPFSTTRMLPYNYPKPASLITSMHLSLPCNLHFLRILHIPGQRREHTTIIKLLRQKSKLKRDTTIKSQTNNIFAVTKSWLSIRMLITWCGTIKSKLVLTILVMSWKSGSKSHELFYRRNLSKYWSLPRKCLAFGPSQPRQEQSPPPPPITILLLLIMAFSAKFFVFCSDVMTD